MYTETERDQVMKHKKLYEKPHAECLSFRPEEDLMTNFDLDDQMSTVTGGGDAPWLQNEGNEAHPYQLD